MFNLNLVNAVSPMMVEFIFFHDMSFYIVVFMLFLVLGVIYGMVKNEYVSIVFLDYGFLEMFWTVFPGLFLLLLALPSLKLLYYLDLSLNMNPHSSVNVVGHQWYWSYYYSNSVFGMDFMVKEDGIVFDSYMLKKDSLLKGDFRLLEVDLPFFVPVGEFVRLLVGSEDVMHSFTMNGFGVKVDAVPGRLKMGFLYSSVFGSFFGQCSEMCGVNHSFMPICLEVVSKDGVM